MRPEVTQMHIYEQPKLVPVKDAYRPRKGAKGFMLRLQCLAFLFLKRYGEQIIDEMSDVQIVTLKHEDIDKAIVEACDGVDCFLARRPTHVFMGPDEFIALGATIQAKYPVYFSHDLHYRTGRYGHDQFYGLEIVVLPWMKGFLVAALD